MGPVLEAVDPIMEPELYAGLNLQLTYQPTKNLVIAEAAVMCATARVGAQLSERLRAAVATDHLRVERLSQRDLAGVGAG